MWSYNLHAGEDTDDQELVSGNMGLQEDVILQVWYIGRSTFVTPCGGRGGGRKREGRGRTERGMERGREGWREGGRVTCHKELVEWNEPWVHGLWPKAAYLQGGMTSRSLSNMLWRALWLGSRSGQLWASKTTALHCMERLLRGTTANGELNVAFHVSRNCTHQLRSAISLIPMFSRPSVRCLQYQRTAKCCVGMT